MVFFSFTNKVLRRVACFYYTFCPYGIYSLVHHLLRCFFEHSVETSVLEVYNNFLIGKPKSFLLHTTSLEEKILCKIQ